MNKLLRQWIIAAASSALAFALPATARETNDAGLQVPASTPAGGPFEVNWTGPQIKGRLGVAKPDGSALRGASYGYDLSEVTGDRIVVLVTDGEETCEGDPALAIKGLRAQGLDVRVNIVGYAIDDDALRDTFESWAVLGRGQHLNAPDAGQLAAAVRPGSRHSVSRVSGSVLGRSRGDRRR